MKNPKDYFKGKLLLFGKIISPRTFFRGFSQVHYDVEKLLIDKDNKKLNIILPRGMGKTTLVAQIFPLHHIFVESEQNEKKFVVIVSKTQGHAINCLTAMKDIVEYSGEFRALFGYHGRHNSKVWREDTIVFDNGSIVVAKGTGQPIRGLNYNGVRPTFIVIDDPEDENNTKTAEAMEANLTWVLKGALPALQEPDGRMCIIGTPLHQLCIVESLKKYPSWETVRYPFLVENMTRSIWPELKTVEDLLKEKAEYEEVGRPSVFWSERMCEIIGDTDQLFKPEYFKYHNHELVTDDEGAFLKTEDGDMIPVNVFMGVDPASSTASRADYTVIFPVAVDKSLNVYTLPYFRGRVTPMQAVENIITWFEKYKPVRTRVESTGYQEMLRDYLRNTTYIPGLEIPEKPKGPKSARLESLQPRFAQGKVYLMEGHAEAFEREMLAYPRTAHDDVMDAYWYACKNVYAPYHEPPKDIVKKDTKYKEPDPWFDADDNDWAIV